VKMCALSFKQLTLWCGIKCFVQQSEQFLETVCAFFCCKKVNLCCFICHNSCGEGVFTINSMSSGEVCDTFMTNPGNTQVFLAYWLGWPECTSFSTILHSHQTWHRYAFYKSLCFWTYTENANRGTQTFFQATLRPLKENKNWKSDFTTGPKV